MGDQIDRQAAIDALRYAQHRFTVADEAGGFGTVKWSEDVIYYAAAERVLSDLPSAQPEPSQVARDIVTIIENEQDMRVIERNAQQWIPCSERLPEKKRKTYWVCTDTEYQCECRWTNNRFGLGESDNWGWSYFDTPQYTEIIAWMPLPEAYKGEQE